MANPTTAIREARHGDTTYYNVNRYLNPTNLCWVDCGLCAWARKPGVAGLEQSIVYVAKLYDEEIHILAGPDITSIANLAGKRVNVDGRGSGTALTASVIFGAVGVTPEFVNDDQDTALAKLKRGEVAALIYVAGKPVRLFTDLGGTGLHLVPIPLSPALLETYLPSRFDHADYPALVPEGKCDATKVAHFS